MSKRASLMSIDFSVLPHEEERFSLNSEEQPFFEVFSNFLLPFFKSGPESSFPQLAMALELFARTEGKDSDVLYALTALEGILTNESNTELAYRLSLRVANLLGTDNESRKRIFKDMREFYDLRSKIVHGSGFKLRPKHIARLHQIPLLREYLRRVLLSMFALVLEGLSVGQLEELLDEIAIDDITRTKVQNTAAKYLHLAVTPTNCIV